MTTSLDQPDIATVLQSLADPVRLEIVRQLAGGELTCGQLELPVGKSTRSHHLKTLSGAGVIAEREERDTEVPSAAPCRARP